MILYHITSYARQEPGSRPLASPRSQHAVQATSAASPANRRPAPPRGAWPRAGSAWVWRQRGGGRAAARERYGSIDGGWARRARTGPSELMVRFQIGFTAFFSRPRRSGRVVDLQFPGQCYTRGARWQTLASAGGLLYSYGQKTHTARTPKCGEDHTGGQAQPSRLPNHGTPSHAS